MAEDDAAHEPKSEIIPEAAMRIGSAAVTSFIPGGAAIHECLMMLLGHRQNKKNREWLLDLERRLSERLTALESLPEQKAEVLTAITEQAFQSARRTFQAEKLEMLKQAVLNAVTTTAAEVDIAIFMGLVDELAVPHLKLLRELADYDNLLRDWRANARQGNAFVQQAPTPEMGWVFLRVGDSYEEPERCAKIAFDLYTRGLIQTRNTIAPTTIQRELVNETTATKFGRAFINFLSHQSR